MRGISGGGVAAVLTPSCPYYHCCLDFPFLPPLPFCLPFGFLLVPLDWWEGCSVVVGTGMVGHCDMADFGIAG